MILRAPGPADEDEFRAAHEELAREGVTFAHGLGGSWTAYLRRLAEVEAGTNLGDAVPMSFRVAAVDGVIVGPGGAGTRRRSCGRAWRWHGRSGSRTRSSPVTRTTCRRGG